MTACGRQHDTNKQAHEYNTIISIMRQAHTNLVDKKTDQGT